MVGFQLLPNRQIEGFGGFEVCVLTIATLLRRTDDALVKGPTLGDTSIETHQTLARQGFESAFMFDSGGYTQHQSAVDVPAQFSALLHVACLNWPAEAGGDCLSISCISCYLAHFRRFSPVVQTLE